MNKKFLFLVFVVFMNTFSFAQLSGIKNIPGDYATIGAAVAALNTSGVGTGGVIFSIADGNTFNETPLTISMSGSVSNPIVFKQSGTGVKPIINFTGTTGVADAAFKLASVNYITIDGLDIRAVGTAMEYGFYLKGTSTAGSQNNLVNNCKITLNKTNVNSKGIYMNSLATVAAGAMSGNKFYNNTVQNCNTGYYLFGNATAGTIDNGIEIGITGTGTSVIDNIGGNAVTSYGIYFANEQSFKIFNTSLSNVTSTIGTKQSYGMFADGNASNTYNIYNNTVKNISGPGQMSGISLYGNASVGNIYNNIIHTVSSSTFNVYGMSSTGNLNIYNNTIYDISSVNGGIASQVMGMNKGIGNFNIYNNLIYDLRNPLFSSTGNIATVGIIAHGGGISNYFNNTIYLDYVAANGGNMSCCVYFTYLNDMVTFNNNTFVNNCNMTNGFMAMAVARSNDDLTNYSELSNNNCFYAGIPDAKHAIWFDGIAARKTFNDFRAFSYPRESQSVSENPPFVSRVAPYNFHMSTVIPTQCESAGIIINAPVTITNDHDGVARFPNSGYPNNAGYQAIAPDLGAFEFGGLSVDQTPPFIKYTPLLRTASILPRTIVAVITDSKSGVPVSGNGLPVLYWNTSANHVWTSNQGVPLGNSNFSFLFGGGVALGDTVNYYFVAQDAAAIPNTTAAPDQGCVNFTANPPASATPSANPSSYKILSSINGNKTVGGPTADYPTLTGDGGLFQDINESRILTGNLKVTITADLYEPGTYALNQIMTDGMALYTVKIVPDGTTVRVIQSGMDVDMITFNGADHVVIDGRYNGDGKYLLFRNTSIQNSVLALQNDATYDTIRNCIFEGGNISQTGLVRIGTSTLPLGNSYNVILNNLFRGLDYFALYPNYQICIWGTASSPNHYITIQGNDFTDWLNSAIFVGAVGNGNGFNISNNNFYGTTAGVFGRTAIWFATGGTSNANIFSGNFIGGTAPQCGGTAYIPSGANSSFYPMYIIVGSTIPTEVQGNTIKNINMTGTGNAPFTGIWTQGAANIGTTVGNVIGDPAVANSILFSGKNTCIGINATGLANVSNNTIANITSNNTTAGVMYGIKLYGDFPITAQRNKIINIGPATGAVNTTPTNPVVGICLQGATTMTNTYLVANNLISLGGNGGIHNFEMDGILVVQPVGNYSIYANSINITGTADAASTRGSAGIYKTAASNVDLQDNIISNLRVNGAGGTGKHYAIAAVNTSNLTSDYNDVYSGTTATTCVWGTTDCNYTTWKSLSGVDTHSVSVNPVFTSNEDLHTVKAELHDAGIALPLVTVDNAGISRGNPPDIGAYEFPLAPVVITNPATIVTTLSAVLNGSVNANNQMTTISFEFGLTTAYGSTINALPATSVGITAIDVNASLTGLIFNTVYHFRVKAVNATGTSYGSDFTFLTVCTLPISAGSITGQNALCQNTQGIVYTVAPITNATGYLWTLPVGASIFSGASTNSITVNFSTLALSGSIHVYGYSACGNGAVSPGFDVTVSALPSVAGVISGPSSVCKGAQGVIFTISPVANADAYAWNLPAGANIISGAGTNSINVNFTTAAVNGVVEVYGTNTCGNGSASPGLVLTVNPIPVTPVIHQLGSTLYSSATVGNQWYLGNVAINGATGSTYQVSANGTYSCVVILNGCSSDVSNSLVVINVAIKNPDAVQFDIFPVPNNGLFTAVIAYPSGEEFNICVYNILGSMVYAKTGVLVNGSATETIDMRNVPSGIYTLTFSNGTTRFIRKMMINRD